MSKLAPVTVGDLFCGAGLFSAGFKQAGFKIAFGIDSDKNACKTFAYNFPNAQTENEDIITFENFPEVDILIGSPPCKDFSVGNNSRGFDYGLVDRFLEIVKKMNPRYWVMENVPAMGQTLIFHASRRFKFPNIQIMKGSDYGAATVRKRFFGGSFPKVSNPRINRCVRDVLDIDRAGFRQPYKDHVYRKIDPDKPLFTLCSQRISNERYLLPNGSSLTVSEMAICQGIPSWFIFPVSRSEMQRQIGNSVCPPISKAIAEEIKKEMKLKRGLI